MCRFFLPLGFFGYILHLCTLRIRFFRTWEWIKSSVWFDDFASQNLHLARGFPSDWWPRGFYTMVLPIHWASGTGVMSLILLILLVFRDDSFSFRGWLVSWFCFRGASAKTNSSWDRLPRPFRDRTISVCFRKRFRTLPQTWVSLLRPNLVSSPYNFLTWRFLTLLKSSWITSVPHWTIQALVTEPHIPLKENHNGDRYSRNDGP